MLRSDSSDSATSLSRMGNEDAEDVFIIPMPNHRGGRAAAVTTNMDINDFYHNQANAASTTVASSRSSSYIQQLQASIRDEFHRGHAYPLNGNALDSLFRRGQEEPSLRPSRGPYYCSSVSDESSSHHWASSSSYLTQSPKKDFKSLFKLGDLNSLCGYFNLEGTEVVKTGASVVVLKVDLNQLKNIQDLENLFHTEDDNWDSKAFKKAMMNKGQTVYIKLLNNDAATTGNIWAFRELIGHRPEKLKLYGIVAYDERSVIETDRGILIIMRDVGIRMGKERLDFQSFCCEYAGLMERTMKLYDFGRFVHGDVYRHNVMYQASAEKGHRFSLVDWDECTWDWPLEREVTQSRKKDQYPARFLMDGKSFTQVQFLCMFRNYVEYTYGEKIVKELDIPRPLNGSAQDVNSMFRRVLNRIKVLSVLNREICPGSTCLYKTGKVCMIPFDF